MCVKGSSPSTPRPPPPSLSHTMSPQQSLTRAAVPTSAQDRSPSISSPTYSSPAYESRGDETYVPTAWPSDEDRTSIGFLLNDEDEGYAGYAGYAAPVSQSQSAEYTYATPQQWPERYSYEGESQSHYGGSADLERDGAARS